MKIYLTFLFIILLFSCVCVSNDSESQNEVNMVLKIDGVSVPVVWEKNSSVSALEKLIPLTIQMSMYGGFEQVGFIGHNLTREDKPLTTGTGDIVLYSGNQIVIFYGSNSWSYTKLGHINLSQQELTKILASADVTIVLDNKED